MMCEQVVRQTLLEAGSALREFYHKPRRNAGDVRKYEMAERRGICAARFEGRLGKHQVLGLPQLHFGSLSLSGIRWSEERAMV